MDISRNIKQNTDEFRSFIDSLGDFQKELKIKEEKKIQQENNLHLEKEANEWKEKGNEAFKQKKFKEALEAYSKAIEIKKSAVYYSNRAFCWIKLENYEMAEIDCEMGLNLDPKFVKLVWRRGLVRKELGKLNLALEDLEKAAVLEPKNVEIQKDLQQVKELLKTKKEKRVRIPIEEIGHDFNTESLKQLNLTDKEETILASKLLTNEPKEVTIKPNNVKNTEKENIKTNFKLPAAPTTSFEFERDWKVVQKSNDCFAFQYLKSIPASSMPSLFKSNLQSSHLNAFIQLYHSHKSELTKEEISDFFTYLAKTDRFKMNMKFVSKDSKEKLKELLEHDSQTLLLFQ